MPKNIRVQDDVYQKLLRVKARLEVTRGRVVSLSDAVAEAVRSHEGSHASADVKVSGEPKGRAVESW